MKIIKNYNDDDKHRRTTTYNNKRQHATTNDTNNKPTQTIKKPKATALTPVTPNNPIKSCTPTNMANKIINIFI